MSKKYFFALPLAIAAGWLSVLVAHAQWQTIAPQLATSNGASTPIPTPTPFSTPLPPSSAWTWNGVVGVIPAGITPTAAQPLYYASTPFSAYAGATSETLTYNYVDPYASPNWRGTALISESDAFVNVGSYILNNANIPVMDFRAKWDTMDPHGPGGGAVTCASGAGPPTGQYCWGKLDTAFALAANNNKTIRLDVGAGVHTPSYVFTDIGAGATFKYYEFTGYQGDPAPICGIAQIPAFWNSTFLSDYNTFITALAAHLKVTSVGMTPVLESTLLDSVHPTGINSVTDELDLPIDQCWPYTWTGSGSCTGHGYQIPTTGGNCPGDNPPIIQANPNGNATCVGTATYTDKGLNTEWCALGYTPNNVSAAENTLLTNWETAFGVANFGRKVPMILMVIAYPGGGHGSNTAGFVGMPGITNTTGETGRGDATVIPGILNTFMGSFPSAQFGQFMAQNNAMGGTNCVTAGYPFIGIVGQAGTGYDFSGLGDIDYQSYLPFAPSRCPSPSANWATAGRLAITQGAQSLEQYPGDLIVANDSEITAQNAAEQFPSGNVNLVNIGVCNILTGNIPQHVPNFSGTPGLSTGQFCYDINNVFGNNSVGSTVDIYTSENPGYAGGGTPITYTINH